MNKAATPIVSATSYDRSACKIGVVHLGFGAFHRAHQAVYLDDYMEISGDLNWGVAAVNLRPTEAAVFQDAADDIDRNDGYYLKSYTFDGSVDLRRVRSHIAFRDWKTDTENTEQLLALPSVHLVTITVTESGYYTDPHGHLDPDDETIVAEINGGVAQTVYAYLRKALQARMDSGQKGLTIACCDNIRQNGKKLNNNLLAYLQLCNDQDLHAWVEEHVAFPCSMVDRITPRSPETLGTEISALTGQNVTSPVMAEDFTQWVLQDLSAGPMPDLKQAGVTVTDDVDPYEETKIRVLNGGHTALAYMAALSGLDTFDEAMRDPELLAHFYGFEKEEVLPAITLQLPFSKADYLEKIAQRFGNRAIGDTVARICADGFAKFPIFVRPTIRGCLANGVVPKFAIDSIASWHQFALHYAANNIAFNYVEPSWDILEDLIGTDAFVTSPQLWDDIPKNHPEFAETLRLAIKETELKWPV